MPWELNEDRPIYAQLIEQIQRQIISGAYQPGERLPSVRDLAAQAAVNPNTMQRALSELERSGLVFTQRTSGRYITQDQALIQAAKQALAQQEAETFLRRMAALGLDRSQSLEILQEITTKEE
ncbi:MAG TPA: GntR family transcriptional regulator [Candidatus Anaerotruncus excrementipullorum]|mgnify:FL=1|uniref:GntR family transcriptional regulator n=1 Tax=Candidatus Anaerotruncus excrementipullorum TaxID=2838465 RepID=A0A9D1WRJ8_9FIRM|nr:GntR family transcriptional regulator [Candidatus Anaerotruncus excrementipullorum]